MPSRFCREFRIYGGRVHSSVTVVIPVLNDGPNLDQTVEQFKKIALSMTE